MMNQNQLIRALSSQQLKQCSVCLLEYQQLYNLSDCQHYFCSNCCVSYIDSQANNFSVAKCLQQGCNKALNKNKQIYKKISTQTKNKIQKQQLLIFIQKNPQFHLCSNEYCNGYFLKKIQNQIDQCKCNKCNRLHCKKCFNLVHESQCVLQNEQQMNKLNYKRCPQCKIWVQKSDGCDYIDCKCQCKFCFKCGNQFYKDPCRKQQIWKITIQIRNLMKNIKINKPQNLKQALVFLPKILLQILLTIIFTIFSSAISLIIVFLLCALIITFGPLILIVPGLQVKNKLLKILCIASIIIFYPVICGFFALIIINIILLYPCLKNSYHHGVYDPFDSGLNHLTYLYLKCLNFIW